MNLIVHRGAHQIGGNCIEVSTKSTRIILDIGQELLDISEGKTDKVPVLPKVKGLYKDDVKAVDAVLISHGHGDHAGLMGTVHPEIPIFIGEKALKILNVTAQFTGGKVISAPVNFLRSGQEFIIGDITVIPYLVDHSGIDAYAFLIKAHNTCIVYTGDLRVHGRKKKATEYFIDNIPKGVDAILVEGTMMSRRGEAVETEENIEQKAYDFMKSKATPVIVVQSSTNIDRLVGMYRAAKRSGRIFVMDIFTAHVVAQLGNSIPKPREFQDVRVFYPYHLTKKMFQTPEGERLMKQFSPYWISRRELEKRKDYCILIRDTMLSDLQHIQNLQGACFIYSMWSRYKDEGKMKRLLEYAKSNSMEIIDLHTSGHAPVEALHHIIRRIESKKVIPIHTENAALFAELFDKVHVAKDGEIIVF